MKRKNNNFFSSDIFWQSHKICMQNGGLQMHGVCVCVRKHFKFMYSFNIYFFFFGFSILPPLLTPIRLVVSLCVFRIFMARTKIVFGQHFSFEVSVWLCLRWCIKCCFIGECGVFVYRTPAMEKVFRFFFLFYIFQLNGFEIPKRKQSKL